MGPPTLQKTQVDAQTSKYRMRRKSKVHGKCRYFKRKETSSWHTRKMLQRQRNEENKTSKRVLNSAVNRPTRKESEFTEVKYKKNRTLRGKDEEAQYYQLLRTYSIFLFCN